MAQPDPPLNDTGPAERQSLGVAGWLAKASIHSPLSPIFLLGALILGILGLIFTPRQEDPQISVPMIDVFVSYPGAPAQQVATLVAGPLERILSEIQGVDHVYSASRRGESMVTVQFEVGEEMQPSLVKLYDKLQSNLDQIPPGVSQPLVKPKAIDDVPVVVVTLWSEEIDDDVLRQMGLDVLQELKAVPQTGPGFVVGGQEDQIRIELAPAKLASYGISSEQIAGAVRAANSGVKAGNFELGARHLIVYSGRFLSTAEDVSRLVVGMHDGIPVYLADVAEVFQGPAETRRLVRHSTGMAYQGDNSVVGAAAVSVAIAKQKGSNGVVVAAALLDKVERLKGQLIPDNVHVAITRDYGKTADKKVNELLFKLFVATGAVTLLVLVTLGYRSAIVVLVVIPVVILLTVFGAWLMGYTVDRVSLFALIFAIGILVDDAIVVVENIYRRWLQADSTDADTAVDAVREVGNPTIIATFTVIAALLPMGFVGDMMGPYMEPIPALGTVAMLISLFAAFVFVPWLTYRIRPSIRELEKAEKREERGNELIGHFYRTLIFELLRNRVLGWLTLIGILIAFAVSVLLFYTTSVRVKMMPYDNKPEFDIVVNLPAGTALPVTDGVTQRLAEMVRGKIPEVVDLQTYVGAASPYNFNGMVRHYYLRQEAWQSDIQVKLLPKEERERTSHEIATEVRDLLTPVAQELGARITVAEMPPGPPVLQTMVAEVYGPSPEIRREVAGRLEKAFEEAENVGDMDTYIEAPHKALQFRIDLDKAMRLGITAETINRTLSMSMGGYALGDVKQGRSLEPTQIVLQVPYVDRAMPGRLDYLPIPAPSGEMVPLYELGSFEEIPADPIVYHKDLRAVEYVVGESVGRLAAPIYGMSEVEELIGDYVTPDGVTMKGRWVVTPEDDTHSEFKWDGEWRVTYITFRDMGIAFAAAMLLIYILVVWEFGNFKIPLIIISPIPLTLIGIIPGHWLMGAEFTATSMIGFIALAGIIVRNSILLVDFALIEIARGAEPREALAMAGQVRMRPIVLTALALVAGSSVILFDPIFQGMAVSLLFGVFIATLLTLIVIPMGCDTFRDALCPAGNGPGQGDEGDACAGDDAPKESRLRRLFARFRRRGDRRGSGGPPPSDGEARKAFDELRASLAEKKAEHSAVEEARERQRPPRKREGKARVEAAAPEGGESAGKSAQASGKARSKAAASRKKRTARKAHKRRGIQLKPGRDEGNESGQDE